MTKTETKRSTKAAKAANPTKRAKAKSAAARASTTAQSRKTPQRADDFWANFTPAQKAAFLNLGEPDVHGPRRKSRKRG